MANNKTYSTKQETLIADYLGWKRVVGSGSRPMHTGDVQSPEWLGECKTHTKPNNPILFDSKVFAKIVSEASAKFKLPAYFVDDGSQKLNRTWVMFLDRDLSTRFKVTDYPYLIYQSITFDHSALYSDTEYGKLYRFKFGEYQVLLTRIDTFSEVIWR